MLQRRNLPNFEKEAIAHANGEEPSADFQMSLVKAMIASARADGSIDLEEQTKITQAINNLHTDNNIRAEVLELFIQPIEFKDFINADQAPEQRAELYLASCLAIDLDHEAEYAYLSNLSRALELPAGLEYELRKQAGATFE